MFRSFCLVASTLVGVAFASLLTHDETFTPDYTLRVTYELTSLACKWKPVGLVNGTTPGPTIYLKENETAWIRVYNDIDGQNLTMHWHGLSESTAPFSDGTPLASQWPIASNHYFDYEIRPSIGEAGTYFYHSHVGFQAVAVSGPLIVEPALDLSLPFEYDDEKIIMITEFFNQTDSVLTDMLTASPFTSWPGETEAILINGQSYQALNGDEVVAYPPYLTQYNNLSATCGPEVFEVEAGKTYRFRTIGAGAASIVIFQFEQHDNLTVIAADGGNTQPAYTDHIQAAPGQRIDFLLQTKTEQELAQLNQTSFWIQFETRLRPANATSFAILKYKTTSSANQSVPSSAPSPAPLTLTDDIFDWLEYELKPLVPTNNFPSADQVTRTVYMTAAQYIPTDGRLLWTTNNHSWTETNEHLGNTPYNASGINEGAPYLVNIYQKGEAAIPDYDLAVSKYNGWDPNLNVYAAKVGEVIDIVFLNTPDGIPGGFDAHPWHVHGGHVWDLGSGDGEYDAAANEQKLTDKFGPGGEPAMRDTTILWKYTYTDDLTTTPYSVHGWRAWRLKVEDAGVWMVHCHILQHMVLGMQSVWVMGNASEITKNQEPYSAGYLSFGGDAYGNATYSPQVNHYFG